MPSGRQVPCQDAINRCASSSRGREGVESLLPSRRGLPPATQDSYLLRKLRWSRPGSENVPSGPRARRLAAAGIGSGSEQVCHVDGRASRLRLVGRNSGGTGAAALDPSQFVRVGPAGHRAASLNSRDSRERAIGKRRTRGRRSLGRARSGAKGEAEPPIHPARVTAYAIRCCRRTRSRRWADRFKRSRSRCARHEIALCDPRAVYSPHRSGSRGLRRSRPLKRSFRHARLRQHRAEGTLGSLS
jgi:hypothetical protein